MILAKKPPNLVEKSVSIPFTIIVKSCVFPNFNPNICLNRSEKHYFIILYFQNKNKNGLYFLLVMIKVTMIGAGSLVFGETLLTDILTYPALRHDIVLCLEDINPQRLDLMYRYMQKISRF